MLKSLLTRVSLNAIDEREKEREKPWRSEIQQSEWNEQWGACPP